MRVGIVSDIHSNRTALEAVAADMPEVDRLVCAGDVVGYNPWPGDCLDWVRERDVPTVMGNHDRMVAGEGNFRGNHMAEAGVRHSREHLDAAQLDWLAALPEERTLFDDRLHVVHGHPDDPDHYTRPREFGPHLLRGADALVMGHTHVQGHEVYEEGVVLNPGSVGQPRDGDPEAAYAVLDMESLTVEERRVEYDVDAVVEAVQEADLPERTGRRLRAGR
jgi:putative phosphoesterase